ncbi:MAG: hypothetical protein AAGH65_10555, partial [Pseudomonadota bacterium]
MKQVLITVLITVTLSLAMATSIALAQVQPSDPLSQAPALGTVVAPLPAGANQPLVVRVDASFCFPLVANPDGLEYQLLNDGNGNLSLMLSRNFTINPCPGVPLFLQDEIPIGSLAQGDYAITVYDFFAIEAFPDDPAGFEPALQS